MSKPAKMAALAEEVWREYVTGGEIAGKGLPLGLKTSDLRRILKRLPSDPRCRSCNTLFQGAGGWLMRATLGWERSKMNPNLCSSCEDFVRRNVGGAEVELSMVFADVRGSTGLAETMSPVEFKDLINRFYKAATGVMVDANALIEKIMGDEVTGLFFPGLAGPGHARVAIQAAEELLRNTGHARPAGPWVPVGVGVHTGRAYVGAIGSEGGVTDIVALGDAVNTAARLAAQAGRGEVVVSEAACEAAGPGSCSVETRRLQLKGRSEPVDVRVLRVVPG